MRPERRRAGVPLPAVPPRPDIQGLRAIAVLLVVLSHAGLSTLSGGYVGVDVFFVVSGFLITSILLHEATDRGSISLVGFYAKRARRILPAATAALAFTAAAATIIMPIVRSEKVLDDVAWAAIFAANIRFGQEDTDYFAVGGPESPIQHFWSLAVEEQFYLVWPALLILLLVVGTRRSAGAVAHRVLPAGLLVAALVALSFTWSVLNTPDDPTGAYFSTTARAWELGLGALLAFAGRALPRLTKPLRALLAWGGLAMMGVAAVTFTDSTPVPGYHIALPVVGTVMVLAAGSGVATEASPLVSRLLGKQPLRWIGDVSYGFYLWHWPFLILGQAYAGHQLSLTTKLTLSGGALIAAWLSYHLLENPIRHATTLRRRPRFALLLWPVAICSLLLVNTSAHAYIKHERKNLEQAAADVDLSDLPRSKRAPRNGNDVHDAVADAVDRAALNAPQPPPDNLKDTADGFSREPQCRAAEHDVKHEICPMGDDKGKRTMVAFGDSHAQMWLPALDDIADRKGYKLLPLIKLGCTPYDVVAWKFSRDGEFTECNEYRPWALEQIRKIKPDVVVVASAPVKKSADEDGDEVLSGDDARQAWRQGVRSLAKKLLKITDNVRFFAAINRLPWEPADCLSDLDKTAADCTFEASDWVSDNNKLVRRGIGPTDARYVGLRGLFCLRGQCPTEIDGRQVYADDDHLASAYARYLADEIEDRLRLPR